jgi:hypothetical protein
MKRDIREIFKKEALQKKKLPNFHEDEFLRKLKEQNKNEKPQSSFLILKVAVSIALIISVGYIFLKSEIKADSQPKLLVQVKKIEKEYLNQINIEWKNFVKLTKDENLIQKYKEKLFSLNEDYKSITKQLEKDAYNVFVLENLIKNLQRRLELIKDIKEHLKELNKKMTSNETIYL